MSFNPRNDICYGRLFLRVPSHKFRKVGNAEIAVSYFLPDYRPEYSYGLESYLAYDGELNDYQAYNPLRFEFRLESIKRIIWAVHYYQLSEEVSNFRVVKLSLEERGF